MLRWLIVIFLALVFINGLSPLLQRLGLGRLPGDFKFKLFGRDWFIPLADALFNDPTLVPVEAALAYVIPMRPVVEGEDKQTDFSTVQVMSGGQSASVALMMKNQMSLLQYPAAAANAVVLLVLVLLMVAGILRIVDIRKEL